MSGDTLNLEFRQFFVSGLSLDLCVGLFVLVCFEAGGNLSHAPPRHLLSWSLRSETKEQTIYTNRHEFYASYLLIIPLICSHFSGQCLCCPRTAPPVRTPPGPQSRGLTQDTLQSPDRGHVTLVTQWHPPNVAATDQNTPDTLSHPAHSPVSEAPGSHSPASHSVLMLTESSPQLLPSLQFSLAPPACWLDSWGPAVVESGAVINLKSRPINPPG